MVKRRTIPVHVRGCPRCLASVRGGVEFCPHCGWPLAIDGVKLMIYLDLPAGVLDTYEKKKDGHPTT